MTRFVAPELSRLDPSTVLAKKTHSQLLDAGIVDLSARFAANGIPDMASLLAIKSEPLTLQQETRAFFELLCHQRVDEAILANLIASARRSDLDQLAATFYNVARLPLVAEPRSLLAYPEDWEDDDTFRARAVASMEARSIAGPEGAYVYQALETDKAAVLDAACYGEEDGALYADGTPVLAPEVLIVLLARAGDGTPSAALLATVAAQLNKEEVRPIGDKVTVEPASVTPYTIEILLRYAPGADPTPLIEEARKRVLAYRDERRAIGRIVQRVALGGSSKVTSVVEIEVISPAADIDPGSKGATFCGDENVVISAVVAADSWR